MEDKQAKVLLVAASKHGSTTVIAEKLAEELEKQGLEVDFRKLQKGEEIFDISGYEAVILGSAVYAGSWLAQARHFLEQHREALSTIPLWLFSSGPLGSSQVDPATVKTSAGDLNIKDHQVFAGKLDHDDVNFGERLIIKVVKAPYGDFRDWEKIQNWGREIAQQLHPAVGAGGNS